jgi:hypothetical protein
LADTLKLHEPTFSAKIAPSPHRWKAWLVFIAATAHLASCGSQEDAGAIVPGIYDLSQSAGPDGTLVVHKDGTYSDMEDNVPKPVDKGTWYYKDGRFCLESAARADALCFAETANPDGAIVLSADGQIVTLTPRS